jgi:serine carboxypeptidase-like clade 1
LGPILEAGYRVLYYSGDLDSTYPFNEAFRWIPKLNLGVETRWREWTPYGRVAGHVINYTKQFTFATVRGAGMNTYIRKRKETNWLLNRFIEGKNPDQ